MTTFETDLAAYRATAARYSVTVSGDAPNDATCACCGSDEHDILIPDDDVWSCLNCHNDALRDLMADQAASIAARYCRLTGVVDRFKPEFREAVTPDEYEVGIKESYTENSVRAGNRHNSTNYDELIEVLSRDDVADQVLYGAIRERVEELIEDAEEAAE